MDLRQTKKYGTFLEQIGWNNKTINSRQYFIKKIPILGSAIKLQRTKDFSLKDIEVLCKKSRVFQIIIEPEKLSQKFRTILIQNGYHLSNTPYLPTKTLQIDVSDSLQNIYNQMKKDARYSIRKSAKLKIYESQDIALFRTSWKAAVGNKLHVLSLQKLTALKEAFGKNMVVIMNETYTSGALFILSQKRCYYWVGFTDESTRKSLVQYQILWRGIQWAKKRKATVFDFEGIYDERFPKNEWKGFTHFKKSFGGVEVKYPGCFTKWRLPF